MVVITQVTFLLLCMLAGGYASAVTVGPGMRPIVKVIEASDTGVTVYLSSFSRFEQASLPSDEEHERPDRCYFDIDGVLDRGLGPSYPVQSAVLSRVRISQLRSQTVRVVLDLPSPQTCTARKFVSKGLMGPNRLRITVGIDKSSPDEIIVSEPAVVFDSLDNQAAGVEPGSPRTGNGGAVTVAAALPRGRMDYLDLRTPDAPEVSSASSVSLFGEQVIENNGPELMTADSGLLEGNLPMRLFGADTSEEGSADLTPLAPGSLYLYRGE